MTGITFALTRYASDWLKQISYAVQPIRASTQIWVVTSHQYEIPVRVPRTSFCGGISGGIANCQLFPQATNLKGHSQLMYMRIRYHFLADLHVQDARETESEKHIRNTQNKP